MSEEESFMALLWESLCKGLRGNAPIYFNINHFNAPGSQLVNSQINTGAPPYPSPKGKETDTENLPESLATEAAMALWRKAQEAGYVDEHFQPTISRTLSAILADEMAVRLDITEKWKTFEGLWNRRNMYRDYYKALNQEQSLTFQYDIKRVFR